LRSEFRIDFFLQFRDLSKGNGLSGVQITFLSFPREALDQERPPVDSRGNSSKMINFRYLIPLISLFACCLPAQAQIQVMLEMDRSLFVAHEPITGKLTIINRAGQDIVLGDAGRLSWLDFTVTDGRGHLISPVRQALNERPIVLTSGQTYEHEVMINRYYPMATTGSYRVKASVTLGQINRVFQTRPETVQVTDGQTLWKAVVGIPQGFPNAGQNREYSLMTFYHGARSKALYFRLTGSDNGIVYKTYPIGDYMNLRPPTHAIDSRNQLHILHMSGPQRYKYTVINIMGDPVEQATYYEKGSNRPELKTGSYGDVSIVGGLTEEEVSTPYEQTQFRRLSERPAGLPNF
ncbi:MAG: hypothetical protein AAGA96_14380, partial [Verrucomicrobiota bacterium]